MTAGFAPEFASNGLTRSRSARERYNARVYARHSASVRRYCVRKTSCSEDAEDAAQDTFTRFLQRDDDELADPGAWLIRVAGRACADLYRRRAISEQRACADAPTCSPDPATVVANRLLATNLLGRMGPRDRQVLELVYLLGLTPAEAAKRCGVSASTMRVLMLRARTRAKSVALKMGCPLGGILVPAPLWRLWDRLIRAIRRRADSLWSHPVAPLAASDPGSLVMMALLLLPLGAGAAFGTPNHRDAPQPSAWSHHLAGAGLPGSANSGVSMTFAGATSGASGRDVGKSRLADMTGPAGPQPVSVGGPATPGVGDPSRGSAADPTPDPVAKATAPLSPGGGILPPADPREENTAFESMTAAPDGTTFATGSVMPCTAPCSAIFRSADAGHSWQHLAGRGFTGGRIILPAGYPADPTLFEAGTMALQRSDDGGASFHSVAPLGVPAAADPLSQAGDAHIAIGGVPMTVYAERTGMVSPGPILPPGMKNVSDVAYAAGGDLLVTGSQLSPTARGQAKAVIALCPRATNLCSVGTTFPTASAFQLSVPSSPAGAHLVTAFGADRLYRSDDDGLHFKGGRVAGVNVIASATPAPDFPSSGALIVAAADSVHHHGLVLRGWGEGALVPVSTQGLPKGGVINQILGIRGALLGALSWPDEHGSWGIRKSTDGGHTWRLS